MSDSDKTNELDNYGVWVKKPPRTVSSENGEDNTDTSDIDNDLPDFAAIDVADDPMVGVDPNADDTTLSADELANITGSFEEAPAAPESGSSGETEEISLDEFIEGGVFEGDEDAAPAPSQPAATTSQAEESVSADDFMESSDITVSDAPSVSESSALPDDGPIDIDLSFDDSDSSVSVGSASTTSSAPVKEVAGSEEVDLSDFGVDFGDGDSSSSSSASSDDGTESVDLSDFGVDFGDSSSSESGTSAEETVSEPVINEDGTEEVSLDSFGFDINAEESGPEENAPAATSGTAEEDTSPSLSDDNPSLEESSSPSIELSAEDDVGDISIEAEPSSSAQETAPAQTFEAQDDDDFNLDSIMDSIEDENGNKTSLNDNSGFVADEPVAEEEAVVANEPVSEEQETVIEEPVVNDVVDMDEPVFEETAVDVPEETITEPVSGSESESDNPFSLPPDDAFTAAVTEEPTVHDEPDENISLTDEKPFSNDPVFEEPVAIDEPATEQVAEDEPVPDESISEEPVSFDDSGIAEEPSQESSVEETAFISEPAESLPDTQEAVVKQDTEISSSANDILNQIASELSSLRNEISNLKTEFEELKNKDTAPAATEPEETETPAESESSGGFFGSEDEDDTIALSLDEMDNILNTVEIVEETAPTVPESSTSVEVDSEDEEPVISDNLSDETAIEEPDVSGESVESESPDETLDFTNENIEEPVLDDIDTNIADEELPDEILVPKSEEDILVGSSSENLIEETSADDSTENLSIDEPVNEDTSVEEDISFDVEHSASTESEDSTMVDEPFVFDDSDEDADATLSADELANITADSSMTEEAAEEIIEEQPVEEENIEENAVSEGSNIPDVSEILGDSSSAEDEEESSGISISEGELDSLLSSEAALAEQNRKLAEEEEKAEPVHSSIPGDLQKEIKSVLSYMDQLLENLPEEKIAEFAQSEQFETYKKLFKELGLD